MVHEKFIRVNGKTYGPYYYESYREGGKVKKRYVKIPPKNYSRAKVPTYSSKTPFVKPIGHRRVNPYFLVVGVLLFLGLIFLFSGGFDITGNVSLDIKSNYIVGESVDGTLKLKIFEGELIPKDSMVIVSLGGVSKGFFLSELVDVETQDGEFYAEGVGILGKGEGYGLIGEGETFPKIDFKLKISDSSKVEETKGGGAPSAPSDDETKEDIPPSPSEDADESDEETEEVNEEESEEDIPPASSEDEEESEKKDKEDKKDKKEKKNSDEGSESSDSGGDDSDSSDSGSGDDSSSSEESDSSEPESTDDSSIITGSAISESEFFISGTVSKEKDFEYNLEKDQDAEIVLGSVKVNGTEIDEGELKVKVKKGEVVVSTKYFVKEEGFGVDYLGKKKLKLNIPLEEFGLVAENDSVLNVKIIYDGKVIVESEKDIAVEEESEEEEIEEPEVELPENDTVVLEVNVTIPENDTVISVNVSVGNLSFVGGVGLVRIDRNGSVDIGLGGVFVNADRYEFVGRDVSASFVGNVATLSANAGFSGMRKGKFVAYSGSNSIESNEFTILVSSGSINIQTLRGKVEVGKQVRWVKNVSLELPENVSVELTAKAKNISVTKVENGGVVVASSSVITGQVSAEFELDNDFNLFRWFKNLFRITGRVVQDLNNSLGNATIEVALEDNANNYLIEYYTDGPTSLEEETKRGKIVSVSGDDELGYTDVISFTEIANSVPLSQSDKIKIYWRNYNYSVGVGVKKVSEVEEESIVEEIDSKNFAGSGVVSGQAVDESAVNQSSTADGNIENQTDSNVTRNNQSDVNGNITGSLITGKVISERNVTVSNGTINESLVVDNGASLDVIQEEGFVKQEVPFEAYDIDGDGNVDRIEWVVPHLSNQTFEIILITKAEHLDVNRSFVSDIFEEVRELDGNWSEPIYSGEYVRVTFEVPLDKTKDITVYARTNGSVVINGSDVSYDIYQKKKRIDEIRRLLNG